MRPVNPDEHWTLHSGDGRQVRAMLLKYLRESKETIENQLGTSTDQTEMFRMQGDRRTLSRLIEALEKDPRKATDLARSLGGLKVAT
jgi:fido (protein-threonine AMPylation protein)